MSEPVSRTSVPQMLNELLARLVGGRTTQAFPALRGDAKNPPMFEVNGIVISLDVRPGRDGEIAVLGQMAAEEQDKWTGATVELKQPYLTPLHSSVDDLGAFTFDTVDPGSVEMTITSRGGMVVRTEEILINT
jgi:hypothetical protein